MPTPADTYSIHDRCLEGLANLTRQWAIPELNQVKVMRQFDEAGIPQYPCVVWTYEGILEEAGEAEAWELMSVWFPAQAYICHRIEDGNEDLRRKFLSWREAILWKRIPTLAALPGVPECMMVREAPGVVINPKLPQYQTVIGAFSVKCLCNWFRNAEDCIVNTGAIA